MSQKYTVQDALGAAIQAYNTNQRVVERDFSRDANGNIQITPNRVLMLNYLEQETVNTECVSQVEELISYLQQVAIIQSLTKGRTQNFLDSINELLLKDAVTSTDFGLLAWAPKLFSDYHKADEVKERWSGYEFTSRFVGKVGDTISINFTMIDSKYIKDFNSYSVFGHDDHHNLVFFFTKDPEKVCCTGIVKGRVKSHRNSKYHNNAKVTTLNYVKAG